MMNSKRLILPALLALVAAGCRSQGEDATSKPTPRVEAPSVAAPVGAAPMADGTLMAKVGQAAPNFVLKDLAGKEHTLAQYKGKTVVLEWFSPGCPFCVYAYGEGSLKTMPEEYTKQGLVWLSINSEAGNRKTASVEENRKFVDKFGMRAPLLLDPTGIVGKSYGAKSTPHMFVIDPKGVLVYQGALDNAPLGTVTDGGAKLDYVGDAVQAVKSGTAVKTPETKSYG
jgi:peroxiredoxin